jgi:hypothetical protein
MTPTIAYQQQKHSLFFPLKARPRTKEELVFSYTLAGALFGVLLLSKNRLNGLVIGGLFGRCISMLVLKKTASSFVEQVKEKLENNQIPTFLRQKALQEIEKKAEELSVLSSFSLYFEIQGYRLVLCKLDTQEIEVACDDCIKKLGEGSSGSILKIALPSGREIAIKVPVAREGSNSFEICRKEIEEEALTLEEIHEGGKIEGIEPKPLGFVYSYNSLLKELSLSYPTGFMMPYYPEGDLFDFLEKNYVTNGRLTLKQAARIIHQLMQAHLSLEKKGFYNTDIKAENLVGKKTIDESGNPSFDFDLIDLSLFGTSDASLSQRIKHRKAFIHTENRTPSQCASKIEEASNSYQYSLPQDQIDRLRKEEIAALKKLVLSQTGVIAHQCFHGNCLPYGLSSKESGYPVYETLQLPSHPKVPSSTSECIKNMIHPDSNLSMESALDHWKHMATS